MKLSKKTALIILTSWLFIAVATQEVRNFSLMERAAIWICVLFFILAIIPFIFPLLARFSRRVKESTWFRISPYFILIYYGLLLILVSINKDIFAGIPYWDISMMGLGVAIIALGWNLLPKELREPEVTETLNKKLRKTEKVIDAFLEESQKLGKRLTAIQKEERRRR